MALSFGTTTNFLLRWLRGTNNASDIDEGFRTMAEDIDTKMMGYSQDTFAKKGPAGIVNRLFKAVDTGQLLHDNGSGFEPIFGPGAQTTYNVETVPGFGPEKVYSTTRWAFVTVTFTKPVGAAANGADVLVNGVVIGQVYQPPVGEGVGVAVPITFMLPPNQQWTINTLNLAALRPIRAAYVLL